MDYFILRDDNVRHAALSRIRSLPYDQLYEVSIKPYKSNRSIAQNRLYWHWISELSDQTGYEKDALHEYFKKYKLSVELVEIFGVVQVKARSTASLDTKQFTEYLQQIENFAVENGFSLTFPDYYLEAIK